MATRKVCLPKAKIASMSTAEKDKVINAKKSAANQGKQRRSSKSNVENVRPKNATLRDWFKKEDWTNVETGEDCGAPSMYQSPLDKRLKFGRKKKKKKKQVKLSVGRGEKLSVKKGSGLTAKGRRKYNKATGGNLKAPVTGKVKPGSKAAKRRKSFCARSAGQMKKFPKAAKDPNSRLRQARKRWRC